MYPMDGRRLLRHTRELLRNRPRTITYAHIEQATGLNRNWLVEFVQGRSDHCSVVYVEKLYEYLSQRNLVTGEPLKDEVKL
jgi:hypothetical protein